MNVGSVVVLVVLFGLVALALWHNRRKGAPCSCGCGCAACAHAGECKNSISSDTNPQTKGKHE